MMTEPKIWMMDWPSEREWRYGKVHPAVIVNCVSVNSERSIIFMMEQGCDEEVLASKAECVLGEIATSTDQCGNITDHVLKSFSSFNARWPDETLRQDIAL